MSMNVVGYLNHNHNLQHDTSEKPSDIPTTTLPDIRVVLHPYDH
jgi:hypothetical protein